MIGMVGRPDIRVTRLTNTDWPLFGIHPNWFLDQYELTHDGVGVVGRPPGLVSSVSGPISILEHLKLTLQKKAQHKIFGT